ncbi:hypothetical protein LCGC14_2214340 [marine sediment metagenome]|uniref:Uncharacterized protein n=1 Tax=marine sediment metagenome TaxID=412755 RepID=A0A0F9DCS9_9ZZZZ
MSKPVVMLDDVKFIDVSWTDKPLHGFAKILVPCPECEKTHRIGEHPDDGCRMGVVDNVMRT